MRAGLAGGGGQRGAHGTGRSWAGAEGQSGGAGGHRLQPPQRSGLEGLPRRPGEGQGPRLRCETLGVQLVLTRDLVELRWLTRWASKLGKLGLGGQLVEGQRDLGSPRGQKWGRGEGLGALGPSGHLHSRLELCRRGEGGRGLPSRERVLGWLPKGL